MNILVKTLGMFVSDKLKNRISAYRLLKQLPIEIQSSIAELDKDSVCVDCGANVGKVSHLFASYGATVYSFEPNPFAYAELTKESILYPTIQPIQKAVGVSSGKVNLYFHDNSASDPVLYSQGSSLLVSKPNVNEDGHAEVETQNLSEFLSTIKCVDILKIDVEGYEVELIPHLIESNALNNVKHVFIETHDHKWTDLKVKSDKMRALALASKYCDKIRFDWV